MEISDIKLSYIVIGCNQKDSIPRCLTAIVDEDPFEIIYVDGSDDNSGDIAAGYNAKTYKLKKNGANNARNFGAKNANGNYLVFTDVEDKIKLGASAKIKEAVAKGISLGPFSWATEKFCAKEMLVATLFNRFDYRCWPACFCEKKLFDIVDGFDEKARGVNDLATLGERLIGITSPKRISAEVYSDMNRFYDEGFIKRGYLWLR